MSTSADPRTAGTRPAVCDEERFSWRTLPRQLGLDLLVCAGVALFLTIIFAAYQDPSLKVWLWTFVLNMIISTSIGMTLSNLYRFVHPRLVQRARGPVARFASHVLIVVPGLAFAVEVALRIISSLGGPQPANLRADVFRVGLAVTTVIVVTAVAFDRLRLRARETELQAQQAQQEALRARLEALQARTNPHFLFNSLNTVAGLIEEDPPSAEKILEKLASLFRYTLDGTKTEWVRLGQEIGVVRDYLDVERIRLGERLRTEFHIEPGVEDQLVPPLVLQPLVENAVLHAVAPRKRGGSLSVRVNRRDGDLRLAVEDDGPGLGKSEHRGAGTSLADLRQRLAMLYAGAAQLETESPPGGGCRVTVSLPLEGTGGSPDNFAGENG